MRALAVVVALVAACGGGGKGDPAKPETAPPAKTAPPPSVIEVGPAPEEVPPPPGGDARVSFETGVPECDDYLAIFDRLIVDCAAQLGSAVDAMKQARDAQADAFREWRKLDASSLAATQQAAAPACRQAVDAMRQAGMSMGCGFDGAP